MGNVTIGTTAVLVVPMNSGRKTVAFRNASTGSQILYLDNVNDNGMTSSNAGYVLAPGESVAFSIDDDGPDIAQPWSAIADGAGATLYYKETSDGESHA